MSNFVSRVSPSLDGIPLENDDLGNRRAADVYPVDLDELAHELRQPLSTIESLAYYLEMTAADDQVCRCLEQIRLMVSRANCILEHASLPA